ncbi:hypothetical protein [Treponema sp.]|uniref:hypothetical protein n=1 Tax=Treponema sp. TaxID=166 RepID=UPI00257D9657|nr:hypothetical protein [Treponema sp.]
MKKLLSFLAAGALALGLIGCSGDLHDYEANEECIGLYLAGDVQKDKDNRGKLTFVDANTQTYKFTYDSTKHIYWGGAKGTINFKLVTDATTWTQDFGWKKDTPVFLSLNDDFLTLQARDAANSNPGNIKVENLINGKEYVITVNYDAPNKVAKVKIEGPSIDFPTLKLVDSDGNEYPLTREGTTYSYVWTPAEAGSKSFYVTNGYMFYDADGKVDTEKPDTEDYVTVSYEANKEYIVKVETAYDKGANVTIYAGIRDTGFFANSDIIGAFEDWKGSKMKFVDANTYTFDFTNADTKTEFDIREKAGDWAVGRWFKGIPEDTADRKKTDMADDIVAAKYGETPTPVVLTYYKGDSGEDGKNAVITGLPYEANHKFRLTIKVIDAATKKVSVTCESLEDLDDSAYAPPAYNKVYLAGNAPLTWDLGKTNAIEAKIVAETETCTDYYYTFTAETKTLDFKVALANGWGDAYSNNTEDALPNKTAVDAAPVEFSNANAKNAQITGLTIGKKYTIVISTASGKPAVSVVPGEDVIFAIGNDDFGKWDWKNCKTLTPAGAGEWKYEFKATNANAEFKFQTQCGGWVDAAQLGADAPLSLGAEYIDLVNHGGATPNIKATLTVGTDYVLSVKKSGDKYQVKIAEKQ